MNNISWHSDLTFSSQPRVSDKIVRPAANKFCTIAFKNSRKWWNSKCYCTTNIYGQHKMLFPKTINRIMSLTFSCTVCIVYKYNLNLGKERNTTSIRWNIQLDHFACIFSLHILYTLDTHKTWKEHKIWDEWKIAVC